MNGIGNADTHPSSNTRRRPRRSDSRPATKLSVPLTTPKATTKLVSSMNEPRGTPNSVSASAGKTVRIMPSVKPTKNTCATRWANCRVLARMPCVSASISAPKIRRHDARHLRRVRQKGFGQGGHEGSPIECQQRVPAFLETNGRTRFA